MAEGGKDATSTKATSAEDGLFWDKVGGLASLIGPTSVLTALLYYFGYVSAKSFYSYFGVSLSALDLSPTAYLINSADTLFQPVAVFLIVLISLFVIHGLLGLILGLAGETWGGAAASCLIALSALLAVIGLWGLFRAWGGTVAPISIAVSAALLEYGLWIALRYAAPAKAIEAAVRRGANFRRGLILVLVLFSVFWAVTVSAYSRGTERARVVERSLALQSQAVVYSDKELQLPSRAVGVARLSGKDSAYKFRYNGLRPLLYSRDRWFLLPVDWTQESGATVLVIRDDPSHIRVDLAP